MDEEIIAGEQIDSGAAGAPEGAVAEPTTEDVQSMYDSLGIKATAPTGAAKGRPKSSTVRAKDAPKDGDGDSDAGKQDDADGKNKPKNAPAASKNGTAGDKADAKASKDSVDDGKVSGEPAEADKGVRKAEPGTESDSERGGEEDAEQRDQRARQEAHDKDDSPKEGEDAEGKRPGKSNPGVERRFQQLTAESREKDQLIQTLQQQLQQTVQAQQQAKIAEEDPEYTIDDFRKVRDEQGNVHELDQDQAELAWRRWQDGYTQRAAERQAKQNFEQTLAQAQADYAEKTMRESAEAFDTLTGLLDTYPELKEGAPEFDEKFSNDVMEIVGEVIQYQEGTEPGNENGYQPVIVGMKLNPNKILDIIQRVRAEKRELPLNGLNDNVEARSNVNVQHSRSSDPNVNAANELYKTLGISKRL